MTPSDYSTLYTVGDLEPLVNVTPRTIYRWVEDGKFPPPSVVDEDNNRRYWDHMTFLLIKAAYHRPELKSRSPHRIVSFFNQKGGVGKTTSVVNFAAALALIGYRTLVVDVDPQGHAGLGLGVEIGTQGAPGTYQVLFEGLPIREAIQTVQHTSIDNGKPRVLKIDVLPADIDLALAEQRIWQLPFRYEVIRNALLPIEGEYDFILIDCPPSLGNLSTNALFASTDLVVPCGADPFSIRGLTHLLETVEEVQRPKSQMGLDHPIKFLGILITNKDRTSVQDDHAQLLRSKLTGCVFDSTIPHYTVFQKAKAMGIPVLDATLIADRPEGAAAYVDAAYELVNLTLGAPTEAANG